MKRLWLSLLTAVSALHVAGLTRADVIDVPADASIQAAIDAAEAGMVLRLLGTEYSASGMTVIIR